LSGYPHLEESYRFAELVFPLLGKGKAAGEQSLTGPFGEMMASDIVPKKAAVRCVASHPGAPAGGRGACHSAWAPWRCRCC
jgi:hypothetical protein